LFLLNQINSEQASVSKDGKYVPTPHYTIITKDGQTIKIGKHQLKTQDGVVIGITVTTGDKGKPTVLYPTDISKINMGFKFEYTRKEETNAN